MMIDLYQAPKLYPILGISNDLTSTKYCRFKAVIQIYMTRCIWQKEIEHTEMFEWWREGEGENASEQLETAQLQFVQRATATELTI